MKRVQTKRRQGFTIIEVLIASTILVIGFAAIIALVGQSNLVSDKMIDESRASILADEVLMDIEIKGAKVWRDFRPRDG
ncbi:MAG: prepilin-type N-terminal cleavage/methylation domain-containing protein, partial [Planctomycetes bacterium]|nr:prepilin-type N-terminal cleavage/methylation domain-containing protein [Planctomycetota bacterium]